MDNASKALIIAGAVLIAVMLVSIGVLVYNSAQGTIRNALTQVNDTEVQLFNAKYKTYFGNKQSRQIAQSLVDAVNTFNLTSTDREITLEGSGLKVKTAGKVTLIDAKNSNFDISQTAIDASGYITKIKIDASK